MTRLALRRPSVEQAVAAAVMGAVTVFVLWQLYPSLIFRSTTPAHGDLAGHLHVADQFRHHILPHGRLSGWSQDWFTGYPSLTYYFPLGILSVVLLGFVVPLGTALKLVAATGPVALPLCAYAFGRLNRCDRLTSACLGVSVLPLLLQPTLFIGGGSLSASAGGELSYGLAQALGLLVVGFARSGLRTGRRRALTAGLLGATMLLHVVQAVMAVVAIVVATVFRPAWARIRWTVPVLAVAGLLAGFWGVPFVLRTQFSSGLDFPKAAPLLEWMIPVELIPILPLALIGAMVAFATDDADRTDLRRFLVVMAAVSGAVFVAVPGGRVTNERFLPLWFLWVCLLGGYGLSQLARAADALRQRWAHGRPLDTPVVALLLAPALLFGAFLFLYDSRDWRGLLTRSDHLGQTATAKGRFSGYERSADRAEYQDYIDTVRSVAREHGCGRLHMETADEAPSDLRQPLVWLTPRWTDGCLTTTHGYFVEASMTSLPIRQVDPLLSSWSGSAKGPKTFDLAAGIDGLRMLGVRYFAATSLKTAQAADTYPELRMVAQTKSYGDMFWRIYEVSDVSVVEPLRFTPVVVPGSGGSRTRWDDTARRWFDARNASEVVVAASGPASWPRHDQPTAGLPRRPTAGRATVSRVRIDQDRISFDVSRTGVPVLVKVSYFPNWQASGADGPWRVTPNQMVVVPTSGTVTLHYGRSPVDHLGWVVTLGGIGGLVLLARWGPIDMPQPEPRPAPERPTPRPPSRPKRKKRR
jgi:hypothetical protein